MVELCLNKKPVQWQVDTGAAVSVISYSTFQNLWDLSSTLKKSLTKLQTYTGEEINVLGSFSTTVSYKGQDRVITRTPSGPACSSNDHLLELPKECQSVK